MANVKVSIAGFKEIKEFFKTGLELSTHEVELTQSMLMVAATIDRRVKDLYNAPGVPSSMMIGKTIKPEALGKTFLRYGLQYREKEIPLIDYPHMLKEVSVRNAIPFKTLTSEKTYFLPINKAVQVTSKVRKRGGYAVKQTRTPFKKFLVDNGYMRGIYTRDSKSTWDEVPTRSPDGKIVGGRRSSYHQLYGPSLAKLADIVYAHDSEVQASIDNVPETLIASINRYYEG
jgi:hypothetical protein